MHTKEKYVIGSELEGSRLDKVLAQCLPDTGLRFRRRLCDEGRVLLDGKSRKPGYKVRTGQEMIVNREAELMTYEDLGLKVITQCEGYGAVYKPGGVHSAAIAGKDSSSVEDVLTAMFPDDEPVLLNRLDYLTSGLLLVALNGEAGKRYQSLEDEGSIRKFYLAEVEGRMDGVVTVKRGLDTDDRKKTRVLDHEDEDIRRWTDVEALAHDHGKDTTLVRCLIMKGARHQIRVHLASLGHPIVGDPLYGNGKKGDVLQLHHQRIELPGFIAESESPF